MPLKNVYIFFTILFTITVGILAAVYGETKDTRKEVTEIRKISYNNGLEIAKIQGILQPPLDPFAFNLR